MRTNLELYLLTLVRAGLETAYDLKTQADVSVGSAIPALTRLEADGLVRSAKVQARGAKRFIVTSAGILTLRSQWRSQVTRKTTDIDSILRTTYLAATHGALKDAVDYLSRAAAWLLQASREGSKSSEHFGSVGQARQNDWIVSLRVRLEQKNSVAAAHELSRAARELARLKGRPRRNRART